MKRRASTSVEWIFRFAGSGTADVIRRDASGKIVWCVRVHGSCVDSREAKRYAIAFRNGEAIPSWVKCFGESEASDE